LWRTNKELVGWLLFGGSTRILNFGAQKGKKKAGECAPFALASSVPCPFVGGFVGALSPFEWVRNFIEECVGKDKGNRAKKNRKIFKLLFSTRSDSTKTRAKPTTLAHFSLSFPSTVGECDRFVSIRVPSGQ
jgi:hypothetical protein